MTTTELLAAFPGLAGDFRQTSPPTPNYDYNCIAWAACRNTEWWEPDPYQYRFWPAGVQREYTMDAYVAAYRTVGFEVCGSSEFSIRFERIVLFADAAGVPTHAARQIANGRWTSKLGAEQDIEHATPEALRGSDYGEPVLFMRRRRAKRHWPLAAIQRATGVARSFIKRFAH